MGTSQNALKRVKALSIILFAITGTMNTTHAARLARSESRIVDGVNVTPLNKYPMIVSIGLEDYRGIYAGTILNKYSVLTTGGIAGFVEDNLKNVRVEAGIYYRSDPDPRYLQTVEVKSVTLHVRKDDASKGVFANDIGILRLSHPLVWNDHVAPTNLPLSGWTVLPNDNIKAIAVGWGLGRNRTYPYPPTRPLQEIFTDYQLCTEPGDFAGVCYGDDGGPLFIHNEVDDKHVQIGITSWTDTSCGNSSSGYDNAGPGYVKVSKYVHWIEEAIRECNPTRDI